MPLAFGPRRPKRPEPFTEVHKKPIPGSPTSHSHTPDALQTRRRTHHHASPAQQAPSHRHPHRLVLRQVWGDRGHHRCLLDLHWHPRDGDRGRRCKQQRRPRLGLRRRALSDGLRRGLFGHAIHAPTVAHADRQVPLPRVPAEARADQQEVPRGQGQVERVRQQVGLRVYTRAGLRGADWSLAQARLPSTPPQVP